MWTNREPLTDAMRAIIGKEIREVAYLYPAGIQELPVDCASRVHEVDHGIRLLMEDGVVVTLMWQLDGVCSALCVVPGSGHDAGITDLVDSYDVSAIPVWASMINQMITNIGVAWHSSEDGCPVTPWALRFEVGDNQRFIVTLAEMRDGRLAYIPDNIAVMFDDNIASSYKCAGGETSSWGFDVSWSNS